MAPSSGNKVEIKDAYSPTPKPAFPPDKFAAEIKRFCKEARIKIHAEEDGVSFEHPT
jgi:hypothetical protein